MSPAWVESPTQATYPSGRIDTAVGAGTAPSDTGALTVADAVTGVVQSSVPDPTFANYLYVIDGSPVLGAPGGA